MSELESNLIKMKVGGRNVFMRRMKNITVKEIQEIDQISSEMEKALAVVQMCIVKADGGISDLIDSMTVEEFGQFVEEWGELQELDSELTLDG